MSGGRSIRLNDRIEVALDGDVDPLSVTPRSVVVWGSDGRTLAARRFVAAGRLVVLVEIDGPLLAALPSAVILQLAGAPSAHALATRTGRALAAPATLRFDVTGAFGQPGSQAPRLTAFCGQPVPAPGPVADPGPWLLEFDGVLDPRTVVPSACPLTPVAGGLDLEPVWPRLAWRCMGRHFQVELASASTHQLLRFDMRRCGLRGLDGAVPEPPVVLEIRVP